MNKTLPFTVKGYSIYKRGDLNFGKGVPTTAIKFFAPLPHPDLHFLIFNIILSATPCSHISNYLIAPTQQYKLFSGPLQVTFENGIALSQISITIH